jgi:hypothetical protein
MKRKRRRSSARFRIRNAFSAIFIGAGITGCPAALGIGADAKGRR